MLRCRGKEAGWFLGKKRCKRNCQTRGKPQGGLPANQGTWVKILKKKENMGGGENKDLRKKKTTSGRYSPERKKKKNKQEKWVALKKGKRVEGGGQTACRGGGGGVVFWLVTGKGVHKGPEEKRVEQFTGGEKKVGSQGKKKNSRPISTAVKAGGGKNSELQNALCESEEKRGRKAPTMVQRGTEHNLSKKSEKLTLRKGY